MPAQLLKIGLIGAGRMAAVLGLAAKKSLAEHRPVHLSEIDE